MITMGDRLHRKSIPTQSQPFQIPKEEYRQLIRSEKIRRRIQEH
jgi:hypothetical protein